MKQTKGKKGKKKRKQEAKPKNKFIIKGNNLYPIYIYIYKTITSLLSIREISNSIKFDTPTNERTSRMHKRMNIPIIGGPKCSHSRNPNAQFETRGKHAPLSKYLPLPSLSPD